MTAAPPQTPLLRLSGLKTSQLPSASATPEELRPFITALLQEAVPFIDSAAPTSPAASQWKSKGIKKFSESAAKVELSERVVTLSATAATADTPTTTTTTTETWACRRSVHMDAATKGTASWAEFARCLRDEHAATEDAFTPTVLAHREALSWAGARAVAPVAVDAGEGGSSSVWGEFSLALVEMKHRIPAPLKPRVFPVLQLIASAVPAQAQAQAQVRARDEFVVVSVPVADLAAHELGSLSKEGGVVVGAYAAVERVRKEDGAKGDVEWLMATASDAKGVLPMWVQTRAVPGQIAKDVALFLGWIEGERRAKEGVEALDASQPSGNGQVPTTA